MDRLQVVATGVSVGASALLLTLGVGLVCDVHDRDATFRETERARAEVARLHAEVSAREEGQRRTLQLAELRRAAVARHDLEAQRREELLARGRIAPAPAAPILASHAGESVEIPRVAFRPIASGSVAAEQAGYSADELDPANDPQLASIREVALAGDRQALRDAIARHNSDGNEPVYLHDDPALASRGIGVTARYDRRSPQFSVTLEARAGDIDRPVTVLVAPGAIVRAGSSGYQDTAPIQARFLKVKPHARTEAQALIACAQIHSDDPRGMSPRGLASHTDPRVARVAAAAERESASWGAAQVAVWAVANNVTLAEVDEAPGNYGIYVDSARDVLEAAGVDTNKLPLYSSAQPKGRRSTFGADLVGGLLRRG